LEGAFERLHATAIAVGQRAIIIRGPSGSGKSDLALRCLALPTSALLASPARLVADDQVILTRHGLALNVTAPQPLLGRLEVRGLGILELAPEQSAKAVLVVDLVDKSKIERYPDPWPTVEILGLQLPLLQISGLESSAPLKILTALGMPSIPTVRAT
jgi:HPr kinase/phosphorylase